MKNRYLVEETSVELSENGVREFNVVVDNSPDPCFIVGVDSGFVGYYLEDLENLVKGDQDYTDIERARILKQIKALKMETK